MGRVVVHIDCKPKDRSISSIINDYRERLLPRGITLNVHGSNSGSEGYESEISGLSGNLVILDENGTSISSLEMAAWMDSIQLSSETTHLAVGPHRGFSDHVKDHADKIISLSRLTLTHEMSAALLMEQLYRATEINRGTAYHRG
tara:strand:- start:14604 stop:15038 length:435 start_codon:yes stop_codon:yes gene_type:complete